MPTTPLRIGVSDDSAPRTFTLPLHFTPTQVEALPETIGAYRIVRLVGLGGMGIVYEAFDPRLKRGAAIKMIRGAVAMSKDAVRRFETEAEAVAQVQHPNIVQIYEVGWHEGQPYVALEYLPGGSLFAKSANKPQPPQEAAALVRTLAEAMHHAHMNGVIHRDLKPANILFAEDGTPKVTDFGAARLTPAERTADITQSDLALTQIGEVIGTPQYMAPEQARGTPNTITPAVDVYALGAVLYHLLTGRPPHDGPDAYDVLNSVIRNDPVSPRRLVPKIPRDLEIICLKALEKHPANRYASAAAMAEDLSRFLAGESILARPDPSVVRLWKKACRKPVIAGLAAGIVLVAFIGLAGVIWQWSEAVERAKEANSALHAARIAEADAKRQTEIADGLRSEAELERDSKEQALYRSQVSEISLMLESGDYRKAQEILRSSGTFRSDRPDPRNWEWHYLNRVGSNHLWMTDLLANRPDIDSVWSHKMAVSPDAKWLAISGGNPYKGHGFDYYSPATMFLVETETGTVRNVWKNYQPEAAQHLAWRDDKTLVTTTAQQGIRVLRVPDGKVLHEWKAVVGPQNERFCFDSGISPDGKFAFLSISPRTLAIFDTGSGEMVRTIDFDSPIINITPVQQSAKHWQIVLGTIAGTRIIDPRTGETRLSIPGSWPHSAAIDAAGRQAVLLLRLYSKDTVVRLEGWNLDDRSLLWTKPRPAIGERCWYEFSPDGDRLGEVYNNGVALRIFQSNDGDLKYEIRGHTTRILDFTFHPDGRHIATASNDGSVRVWNKAAEVAKFRGHTTGARLVAFDPNGWRLYSGGMDNLAIAWDFTRERGDGTNLPLSPIQGPTDGGAFAGGFWFGPDGIGRYLDTTRATMFTFDPATFTPQKLVTFQGMKRRPEKTATDFALSADARFLIGPCGEIDREPILWDAATGAIVRRMKGVTGNKPRVIAAALSADGSRAAATLLELIGPNQPVRQFLVWDATTGKVLHHEVLDGFTYGALAFDPVKPRLYLGIGSMKTKESGIDILDLATMSKIKMPLPRPTLIRHIAVSPNGRWVAYIDHYPNGDGPRLLAFDPDDPRHEWKQEGVGPATGLAFSADSQRLALARFDDALVIYNANTGIEAFLKAVPSTRHGDYAFPARVAFSPDGRSLVMNHSNAQLSVWRTDDWQAPDDRRKSDRRQEAENAAYAFHLRAALELKNEPQSAGYRYHAEWLDKMTPPNDFVANEWFKLKEMVAR